jgi:uncharacterized surface protein with fasciclin (FAS1) repeats
MKKIILNSTLAISFSIIYNVFFAQNGDIVEAASKAKDLGTLSVGVIAADLSESYKKEGPFTFFAPSNAAFEKLPEGILETLLLPSSKDRLAEIINFHVIKGYFDSQSILTQLNAKEGKIDFTTMNGKKIVVFLENEKIRLLDENGNIATITSSDLKATNGIIHTIDNVIIP